MRAAAPKLRLCRHRGLKSEQKTATFGKFGRSRKRGPKDGWNGLTLKILRYVVEKGIVTRREIEEAFGLTRNAVLYHLRKLRDWGLVVKVGKGPATVYIFDHKLCGGLANWSCPASEVDKLDSNDGSNVLVKGLKRVCRLADNDSSRNKVGFRGLVRVWLALCLYREYGRAVSARELATRLGYSIRYVQRCLAKLARNGLAVPTGGRRCRFVAYIPACLPKGIVHVHKHVRRHKYRRRYSPKVRDKYSARLPCRE